MIFQSMQRSKLRNMKKADAQKAVKKLVTLKPRRPRVKDSIQRLAFRHLCTLSVFPSCVTFKGLNNRRLRKLR